MITPRTGVGPLPSFFCNHLAELGIGVGIAIGIEKGTGTIPIATPTPMRILRGGRVVALDWLFVPVPVPVPDSVAWKGISRSFGNGNGYGTVFKPIPHIDHFLSIRGHKGPNTH